MLVHSWDYVTDDVKGMDLNCKQQNATDFTCDEVNELSYYGAYGGADGANPAILKDRTEHNVTKTPARKNTWGDRKGWFLPPGFYEIKSDAWVEIPAGKAGWVIHRSSLNRNGVMVVASLYDSGFNGNISATMYVMNPAGIFIEKGARVGQFVMAEAETLALYQGQYQSEKRQ